MTIEELKEAIISLHEGKYDPDTGLNLQGLSSIEEDSIARNRKTFLEGLGSLLNMFESKSSSKQGSIAPSSENDTVLSDQTTKIIVKSIRGSSL